MEYYCTPHVRRVRLRLTTGPRRDSSLYPWDASSNASVDPLLTTGQAWPFGSSEDAYEAREGLFARVSPHVETRGLAGWPS